jgi:GWxTD domain-containing protein
VGDESPEPSTERLPRLFDPSRVYREMGLLTDAGPLGFVASARVVAGPSADSLFLGVGVSLRNRGFVFQRDGDQFVAEYRVEITVRSATGIAAMTARDERVRVGSFRETQRGDESVIFQDFLAVAPGEYVLAVSVRDRNGTGAGRAERPITIPALQRAAVSLPIAVYEATARTDRARPPQLVLNARQSVEYGTDSVRFYVETYDMAAGSRFVLAAVEPSGREAWSDTIAAEGGPVRGLIRTVPPAAVSIGRYDLQIRQRGQVMGATPFVVAFSDQYAVANLEDIVSLLRYFPAIDSLRAVVRADPAERPARWQRFWRDTDPNPASPEHEAIDEYLSRVRAANEQFADEGGPGWLTERGEVFISLGPPSEIYDRRADQQLGRGRYIVWTYLDHRLTLTFIDDTGFGRYRLDPRSRSEFMRIRNQLRAG